MADRSISFDLLAIDKASVALAKVGKEVADRGDQIDQASGTVEIDADTAKAREQVARLDSDLAKLNAKSLRIDMETAAAERQLAILRAELARTTDEQRQVRIDGDISGVMAKLAQLRAEKVSVDVDTNRISSSLARVRSQLDGLGEQGGGLARIGSSLAEAGSSAASAAGPVGAIAAALGIVAASGAAAQVALAGVGFAMGGLAVAGGGMAAIAAGFDGIGQAMSAIESGNAEQIAKAMSNLGPAAQEFATFMKDFTGGPLKELRMAGQEAFLPGIQDGLKALQPMMKELQPVFAEFSGTLGKALGDLIPILGSVAKPFMEFATSALKGLQPLQPAIKLFAEQLGVMFSEMAKSGAAQELMRGFSAIVSALLPVLPALAKAGIEVAIALGPAMAEVFKALADAIIQMLPSLVAMAPQFADILTQAAPLIPLMLQMVPPILQLGMEFLRLAIPMMQLTAQIMGPVAKAFGSVLKWMDDLGTGAGTARANVANAFNTMVGFITGLPGRIGGALSRLFSPLWTGVRSFMNQLVRGWNSLHFSVPSVTIPGLGTVGGGSIGVGQIAYLARGGIVTGPTLAMVGEGGEPEMVTPLSKAREMGFGGGGQALYLTLNLHGVLAGDEAAFGRTTIRALRSAVDRGELPRSFAPA